MADHPSDDLDPIEASLLERIGHLRASPERAHHLDPMLAATLLEAQITSRVIDHTARWLRSTHGLGHYTIASAGHESNALVALSLEPTDPALLHYRSGAFYIARALQAQHEGTTVGDPADDILRGMLARSTEPIAGGRHKVFGNHVLSIIPQTSTIASHLPRAVGLALSFELADSPSLTWPVNSVVMCSFGDASLNHSTAQGAINWASQLAHSGHRVPILFVCEDNGLGLSVPTDPDWVADSIRSRPSIDYTRIDGTDPWQELTVLPDVIQHVRNEGRPAFVHLDTVRYLGHAGTDVESAYRSPADIRSDLDRDPILFTAELAIDSQVCDATEIVEWYYDVRNTIRGRALELAKEPSLDDASAVMKPLVKMQDLRARTAAEPDPLSERLTLSQSINHTLQDLLAERSKLIVFGEDVGRKGGVYGVTRGLQKRFGDKRVFDTVLDEQSVLGLGLGASLNGFLPLPEIQYLAYLHNAEDQIRGEGATLAFFSQGQYVNPMVVRVAAYGYQKGFGGHFHNDNSITVLRDIPGLVIASPAHPSDAAPMLRTCVEHAAAEGAVCVYLEPIALYHTVDLHEPGDQLWTTAEEPEIVAPLGGRLHGEGTDLTILTWANGVYLSQRAARKLHAHDGIEVRILDLRWLAPLPVDQMLAEARVSGRVLVVDETRRTGGVGETIISELIDSGYTGQLSRIAGHDSFIPLGAAANHVLVAEDDIVEAARDSVLRHG